MASTYLSHPNYRSDIDGLRAIAVLAVVIFHAFPSLIAGGFIGVDIFFVISGYLISGIVLSGLEKESFSFSDFYLRRIKRIFPALFLILVTCLFVGWLVLMPDEFKMLGKHIAGGSVFASNFILQNEVGYFGAEAESKQLLHLWSLAVEEQFYIVWPFMLWMAFKRKWNLLVVIALAAAVSFYLNIRQAGINLSADFYYPQTRFWELILGGALACIARKFPQVQGGRGKAVFNAMSIVGLLLLAGGFWLLDKEIGFPGKWALIPVVGAILIILAGPHAWVNRVVLSHPVLVWVGLISFPLYLWHWPVLSFLRTVLAETPGASVRCAAVLASVFLAWLTFRFIEKPIRFGMFGKSRTLLLAAVVGVTGVVGLSVFHQDGFSAGATGPGAFVAHFNGMVEWTAGNGVSEAYRHQCNFLDIQKELAGDRFESRDALSSECYVRDPGRTKSVFIWGDSHAQQLYFGLSRQLSQDWQVLQVATSGCQVDVERYDEILHTALCEKSNRLAKASIARAKPDIVLVSQVRPLDANTASKINQELLKLGAKNVLFVGPVTRWQTGLAKLVARNYLLHTPRYTFRGLDMEMYGSNIELKKTYAAANINYADVMSVMCNDDGCLTYLGDDVLKGLTTYDYGHLLPVASEYIAKNLLVPQIYRIDS